MEILNLRTEVGLIMTYFKGLNDQMPVNNKRDSLEIKFDG